MLAGAGITSNTTRLLLQGLQNVCQFVGAIFGALLTDRIGRRAQLLTSTALMVLLFSIITALNATNVDPPDDETGGVVLAEASHDGYVRRFGLVHQRQLTLSADGRSLSGEDRLIASGRRRRGPRRR